MPTTMPIMPPPAAPAPAPFRIIDRRGRETQARPVAPLIAPIIKPGKIHLGVETLRCPQCRFSNKVEITSDLPAEDWLTCAGCGYKALLDIRPIRKKYGLPHGLSIEEKRDFSHHLQADLKKM